MVESPPRLCSGRESTSGAGGREFYPKPGHTKYFENGSNGWCQDTWTSNTGILPRKRRDITKQLLSAA